MFIENNVKTFKPKKVSYVYTLIMTTSSQETNWLERVETQFMRFGIKSITMDDVAHELGISKKTLYQMVESKDALVIKVLDHHISREKTQCLCMAGDASNAIEEIFIIMDSNSQELAQMKTNIINDLQKYHRDAWVMIRNFQYDFVLKVIRENITRGRNKGNFKMVLLALFGAVMGQGVVWYTGQFYAQSFLENTCKIEFNTSRYILLWAIVFATPLFILFGYLSDRVGRKWIIITGMALAVLTYRPIYKHLHSLSVITDNELVEAEVIHTTTSRGITSVRDSVITFTSLMTSKTGWSVTSSRSDTIFAQADRSPRESKSIYSNKKPPPAVFSMFVLLVFVQILYVTMVYGPMAAFLVELFPTRIRYTSMSLPYHIGNGVFGGLVPFLSTLIASFPGSDYRSGLWYPILVAGLCAIIGTLYLKNKIDLNVDD